MNKLLKAVMLAFFLCFSFFVFSQNNALWLRYPAISPNGESILFNYKGDIYKVAANGGLATPLTLSDSYEYNAVWSNDGKSIAFASNRYGNFDVFIMPANGGDAQRLTYHSNNEIPSSFTADNLNVVFEGLRQDAATNVQYPTGVMAELYNVPVSGGRVAQVLTTPAHDATFSSDGKKLIFHDRKGYENNWRKHHTSAVTRDVWLYDIDLKEYKQLSTFEGENRNPVFNSSDDVFYYLSEETGSFNVHQSSISNSSESKAITDFKNHPVRFLSISKENTLCFSYDGEVYTKATDFDSKKVVVEIANDGRANIDEYVSVNDHFTEAVLSSNGKEFAYVFRGEIFVSSIEHGTTKRITSTPWQERSVSFSPDGRTLLYAAEVNGSWNLYTQSIVRDAEAYFFTSTLLKEETLLASDAEEFQPAYSPNGEEVAYYEDRTTIRVFNLKSKESRTVLDAKHNYSYADGDQHFEWSPDSKWLLVQFGPMQDVMLDEVGLVDASGNGEVRNLTQSGYYDFGFKWSADGKMMIWGSTREAEKGENTYPSSADVYAMFFTQKAFDRFNLSKEEAELLKEKEKKAKEGEDDKDDKKSAKKDEEVKVEDLSFDWDNLYERKKKLTVNTSKIKDWVLSKEADKLYYLTRFEKKNNIWVTDLKSKETKLFAKIGGSRTSMELSDDGKFFLVLSDGKAIKVDIKDAKVTPIKTKGEMLLKRDEERAYIFDHSWRQVREKFYVEDIHGVDWDFYYDEYKKFLPCINNNYDYTEMLSEMLGELNASHTGSGYRVRNAKGDKTASLGVLVDYSHTSSGIKVAEVVAGGPLDKAESKVKPNDIIEKIDGVAITTSIDWYQLLNRKEGHYVLLSMYSPDKKERWDEVVKPISLGKEYGLLYKRWVKSRELEVERLSGGKLGYVHVKSMNDASMRNVYDKALGKYIGTDALIVDTRFNGGGNLHDALADFLNGEKYMEIIPHGQYIGHEPGNKWIKPSIVVMSESNYSDAHLFPVVYKMKEIGQTLGMPVPGTGTFVWWELQIDPTIYFGIPMGGWRPPGEAFLENTQLEPDIRVPNEPKAMSKGSDQQIEAAVKELLK